MAVDGTMSGPHYEPGFGRGKGAKKAKSTKGKPAKKSTARAKR